MRTLAAARDHKCGSPRAYTHVKLTRDQQDALTIEFEFKLGNLGEEVASKVRRAPPCGTGPNCR